MAQMAEGAKPLRVSVQCCVVLICVSQTFSPEEASARGVLEGLGGGPKQPAQDKRVFKVAGSFLELHMNFSFS